MLRLFFALWPDPEAMRQFSQLADQLGFEPPARVVNPKNLHLTLAFLGEVPDSSVDALRQAGSSLRAPPVTLHFDCIEYWNRSRAVVAVAQAAQPLSDFRQALHAAIGFVAEQPFRAHVTLARKMSQAPVHSVIAAINWRAEHFSLIRSDTGGAESAYTVLDTWPLLYEN